MTIPRGQANGPMYLCYSCAAKFDRDLEKFRASTGNSPASGDNARTVEPEEMFDKPLLAEEEIMDGNRNQKTRRS